MHVRSISTVLSLCLPLVSATARAATTPPPALFDMIGFIQDATLDGGAMCPSLDPSLRGGTMTINGIRMTVPCNTILQFPASSMSWAQIFDAASFAPVSPLGEVLPPGPGRSGLALVDSPSPFPSFDVHVQGNVLVDPLTGAQTYVVGLIVPIAQQGANAGAGFVTFVDYAFGTLRVAGIPGDPHCVQGKKGGGMGGPGQPACSGALLQINDPKGRYGKIHSPDPRFTADTENPTIAATTGIPVCIPTVAPPRQDPACPQGNRPLNGDPRFPIDRFKPTGAFLTHFDMPRPPATPPGAPGGRLPDPRVQVPIEVGDWITFAGSLYKVDPAGDASPQNTYLAVHTLSDSLGIFTHPGVPPAYVTVQQILIGAGGAPVLGLSVESTTRLTVVGFTTDPTRGVKIDAIDVNPCTGVETRRLLASPDPATQPVRGRFVERVVGGFFMPPTREYVAVSATGVVPAAPGHVADPVHDALLAGQYRVPNFAFVFPDSMLLGGPVIPANFQDIPFLAQGSGPLGDDGPVVGPLFPWPGTTAPAPVVCAPGGAAPIANAGPPITVLEGTLVTLTGSTTVDPNSVGLVVGWAQIGGPAVTLSNADTPTPTFTAPALTPGASVQLTFQLTAADNFGTSTSDVTVTVTRPADVVAFILATWRAVVGSKVGKLVVIATSTDPAATLSLDDLLAVDGSDQPLGTLTSPASSPGTFTMAASSVPEPGSLILRSTAGGTATAVCAPSQNNVVICQ
jgi:hypothetical protein